ncbi:hypothetical protein BZA05DRAFT_394858 [Tricharina praecox]|uniref:uncharacterized protein n=1 Tax=Tricharina praecox TaxID=43433 RepID=UPI00221F46B0|nr:uncharacterized protein BZA05DRAFT_394858 [Tricharina praecox]KAI5853829.1 hypothetical protein BZA05DRAFT_394858 [Tricharina praecox]
MAPISARSSILHLLRTRTSSLATPQHLRLPSPPPQNASARRSYLLLRTTLNPKNPPLLPKNLPAPPNTIILLTSPDAASSLTAPALFPLTNDSTVTLLSASVDSLPGSKGGNGSRVTGYSWLITDHSLPIRLPSSQKLKSLTFSLPNANFTLALANTVFQNGQESTVVHMKATARPKLIEAAVGISDPEVDEFANAQEDIKEAWQELGDLMKMVGVKSGIVIPNPVPSDSVEIQISDEVLKDGPGSASGKMYSQMPLTPLTKPRKITEGMGNILRTLEGPDGDGDEAASRELESAVDKYLDSLPEGVDTPERVDVFARLTTQEPSSDVTELLFQPGVRLHRVLSGGGGWGSKAGLLSLDPQNERDVSQFAHEFEARFDGDADYVHDGIVQKGQWIQFFIAENGAPAENGLQFGAVGKIEDVRRVENDGKERTIDGCFGGASECGVDVAIAGKLRRMDVPGGAVIVDV